jgi:hypothetical protein
MTRDYQQFPDDENGNLLWQMVEDGGDLTEPYEVEFSMAFEHKEQAEKCALNLLHQEKKSRYIRKISILIKKIYGY